MATDRNHGMIRSDSRTSSALAGLLALTGILTTFVIHGCSHGTNPSPSSAKSTSPTHTAATGPASTQSNSDVVTRASDILDLIMREPGTIPSYLGLITLEATTQATAEDKKKVETRTKEVAQMYIDTIRKEIAPDTWQGKSNPSDKRIGTIDDIYGCLVINQTVGVHEAVRAWLNDTKKFKCSQVGIECRMIRVSLKQDSNLRAWVEKKAKFDATGGTSHLTLKDGEGFLRKARDIGKTETGPWLRLYSG